MEDVNDTFLDTAIRLNDSPLKIGSLTDSRLYFPSDSYPSTFSPVLAKKSPPQFILPPLVFCHKL